MRTRLLRLLYDLRASYWFLPSVMALIAIMLGAGIVWLDAGPAAGLLDGLGWYQTAKPDGAQEVLSTIAGSMITVAGVVFSITIVAIAYAASQYGPRILTNFMSDRGNQVTLGTFIATFVYCLVVLRTIRGGDEGEFVPQIAVMIGLFLALCSIAVFIYFIHHVPNSIHINNVVARIGKQLLHLVDKQFPADVGEPSSPADGAESAGERCLSERKGVAAVGAKASGYIESLDDDGLMGTACDNGLVLQLHRKPGDFVFSDAPLMSAWPAEKVDDHVRRKLQRAWSVGNSRSPTQDIFFLIDELVEIAARALSTGVNDPYTAITCLDWLGAGAAEIGQRPIPSHRRQDENGAVRVIVRPENFETFIERGFGRMRPYLARDANAATHAFVTLSAVGAQCGPEAARTLQAEAGRLMTMAEQELEGPSLDFVRGAYQSAAASITGRQTATRS